jgi:hypothetical protein
MTASPVLTVRVVGMKLDLRHHPPPQPTSTAGQEDPFEFDFNLLRSADLRGKAQ